MHSQYMFTYTYTHIHIFILLLISYTYATSWIFTSSLGEADYESFPTTVMPHYFHFCDTLNNPHISYIWSLVDIDDCPVSSMLPLSATYDNVSTYCFPVVEVNRISPYILQHLFCWWINLMTQFQFLEKTCRKTFSIVS